MSSRLNDQAFKALVGIDGESKETIEETEMPLKPIVDKKQTSNKAEAKKADSEQPGNDMKLVRQLVYITKAQQNALRLRKAYAKKESDRDISSIVRSALDRYLKSDLENLRNQ